MKKRRNKFISQVSRSIFALVLAFLLSGLNLSQGMLLPEVTAYAAAFTGENPQKVFQYLTGKMGLNSAAACGIMANVERESSFNPAASGSGGRFYGLFQWGGSRQTDLFSYCKQNGYNPASVEGQMYFLEYELNKDYQGLLSRLRTLDNTAEGAYSAGYAWCYEFERPGDIENNSRKRGELARDGYWPVYGSQVLPFRSCIDSPVNGGTYDSSVQLRGWAIYGNGITRVAAVVNGNLLFCRQEQRADVASAYAGYPVGNEGFVLDVPVNCLKEGTNEAALYAYSNEEKFEIGKVTFICTSLDHTPPVITDVAVSEITVDGYQVTCTVTDDRALDRVQFPTWTSSNGQDDLEQNWSVSDKASGVIVGNTVTFQVQVSDHFYEDGEYITHIYAYDKAGNSALAVISCNVPSAPLLYGDVDNNRKIEIQDVMMALQGYVGVRVLTDRQMAAADMDGQEGLAIQDILGILKKVVGLD